MRAFPGLFRVSTKGRTPGIYLALTVFVAMTSAPAAQAQVPRLQAVYRGQNYSAAGRFGQSITTLNDQFFLVGAPDSAGSNGVFAAGAAVMIDAATGGSAYTLSNPRPTEVGGRFGVSAAVVGDRLVIGANGNDTAGPDGGEAFVFSTAGTLQRTVSPRVDYVEFGTSVGAVDSRRVVVGGYRFGQGRVFQYGAAFVYDAGTGTQLRRIENPTPQSEDFFGMHVAGLSGGRILVASHNDDSAAHDAGAVYLFDAGTGGLLRSLVNPDSKASAYFGLSIAPVGDDRALVGAQSLNTGPVPLAGVAYLVDLATGDVLHRFVSPNATSSDGFGSSLTTIGDRWLAIAAPLEDSHGTATGHVYLFDQQTYQLVATIPNPQPLANAKFGYNMSAFRGNELLIGAFEANTVYRYVLPEPGGAALSLIGLASACLGRRRAG
jgi:hypothetical protein